MIGWSSRAVPIRLKMLTLLKHFMLLSYYTISFYNITFSRLSVIKIQATVGERLATSFPGFFPWSNWHGRDYSEGKALGTRLKG